MTSPNEGFADFNKLPRAGSKEGLRALLTARKARQSAWLPLTTAEQSVWTAIVDRMGKNAPRDDYGMFSFPSQPLIAEDARVNVRTVRRAVHKLVKMGLLRAIKTSRDVTKYYLGIVPANSDDLQARMVQETADHPGHHVREAPDTMSAKPRTPCPPNEPIEQTNRMNQVKEAENGQGKNYTHAGDF